MNASETNGSVSAKNELVNEPISSEIKAKIAQCLAYSMEIEGAIFYHQPSAKCVRIYSIVDDVHIFQYETYDYYQIDNVITLLKNRIAESEVSNG